MVAGYQLIDSPYRAAGTLIGRARRLPDDTSEGCVWLVWPDAERTTRSSPAGVAQFRGEYEFLRALDVAGVIKPRALIDDGREVAMLVAGDAGTPLEELLGERRLSVAECLDIAIRLSVILEALHGRGLVHGEIRPAHLLRDPASGELSCVALNLAAAGTVALRIDQLAAEDLAYVSPEQTGRLNRKLDYRTDFYTLGVVLYRLLTGQLPFAASDPLAWVHCHIGRSPRPPAELSASVPSTLSAIVLKLLAKAAEDRYQSAQGLRFDLQRCQAELRSRGEITPFLLGAHDVSQLFQIAHKCYGREVEIAALQAAFGRVSDSGRPELILVSGPSGIGKSSLVDELRRPVSLRHGYFVSGKVGQQQRNVPYASIAEALRSLLRQLLGEHDALSRWRPRLQAALGTQGRLLGELIPEIELIVGPQASVSALAPAEAQNRFQRVFCRFVGVFAQAEHPLVLFLDDLQWLDAGTLALIDALMTHPDLQHLLLIGAYREEEAGAVERRGAAQALAATLARIDRAGTRVGRIALNPLKREHLEQLSADALHCATARAAPLARLILAKTQGNPFFFIQFLSELQQEGLIAFYTEQRAWTWDMARIAGKSFTDNVVELMLGKLGRLPPKTRQAVQWASCLGNTFDLSTLAVIGECSPEEAEAELGPAVRAGLVVCRDGRCRFLHDRVQEAAYSLIAAAQRPALHLRVGRLLVARAGAESLAEQVFDVVGHLDRGSALISDADERERLCRLNSLAGKKAMSAAAYAAARAYFAKGVALLAADAWRTHYAETFELALHLAECEYLVGNFAASEEAFDHLLAKADTDLDRARACRLRSRLYQMTARFDEAMQLILDALRWFGVALPAAEEQFAAAIAAESAAIRATLGERPIASLADAPAATDPVGIMIVSLLVEALGPAFAARPQYFPWLAAKAASHSLRFGNTAESGVAYHAYAVVLAATPKDMQAAFEFSEMAIALLEKFDNSRPKGLVLVGHGGMVLPWRKHFASALPFVERGLATLVEAGDFLNAAYSTMFPVWGALEAGRPLDEVLQAAEKYARLARELHHAMAHDTLELCRQWVASLKRSTRAPARAENEESSEEACLARFRHAGWHVGIAYYQVMRQITAFIHGRYAEALEAAAEATAVLRHMTPMPLAATLCFYRALTLAALYPELAADEQRASLQTMTRLVEKLRLWADNCPENYLNRYALASAEVERIKGRDLEAMRHYEQAIGAAHEHGLVHNEALAYELAAGFYRGRGYPAFAADYLLRARACYAHWGANGKLRQLDARCPPAAPVTGEGPAEALDAMSMVKASQAISGEVVLDRLLETLMHVVVENAGAQKGCLILARGEAMSLAATAAAEAEQVGVRLYPAADDEPSEFPASIVNYVRHSREKVILADAAAPNPFASDAYLALQRPKSVLCLPILRQAELIGVLYLENRLITAAFTPDRLAVLELLAAQAAISLDNARLYADLRQENHERQRTEEALHASEQTLRELVDMLPVAVSICDLAGHVESYNRSAVALWGYAPGVGNGATDCCDSYRIYAPDGSMLAKEAYPISKVLSTGAPQPDQEIVVARPDGTLRTALISSIPRRDERGTLTGVINCLTDITDRQQAAAERQGRQAAEAASRAKSEFLANMSHELRSPLNTILGFARLMASDPALPASAHDDLDLILNSGDHLYALINQVLDLSRLEAGHATRNDTDFDLPLLLDDLRHLFTPAATDKGLQMRFELAAGLPRRVRSDALKLRQVLINLIDNALKFTREGAVRVGVEALAQAGEGDACRLIFTVVDSGPGIARHELDQLFDAFVQAEAGRQARQGTGLGLAICRGFVRLLGGEIELSSELGKGCSVRFEIPVQCVSPPAAAALPDAARFGRVLGLAAGQPRYRILVVDDQPAARELLVRQLAPLGFQLKEAVNGRAAISVWQHWRPHVILMDLAMPVLDGVEASRRICGAPRGPHSVVLALTAGDEAERRAAVAAGCAAVLRKPLRQADLFAALEKHLGVRYVYREEKLPLPPRLDAAALASLPEAQRAVLEQALVRLDPAAVDAAIDAIRAEYAGLALALDAWARDFHYDAILLALRGEPHLEAK